MVWCFSRRFDCRGLGPTQAACPERQFVFRNRHKPHSQFHLNFLRISLLFLFLNGFQFAPQNAFLQVPWRWCNTIIFLLKQKIVPISTQLCHPSSIFGTLSPQANFSGSGGHRLTIRVSVA